MKAQFDKLPLYRQMEILTRLRFVAAVVAASEVTARNERLSAGAAVGACIDCEHGGNCTVPDECRLNFPPLLSTN